MIYIFFCGDSLIGLSKKASMWIEQLYVFWTLTLAPDHSKAVVLLLFTILFGCIFMFMSTYSLIYEPRHDKTNNVDVRPAKTQISLGIRPVWSESSLSAWRKLGSLATH